MLTLNKLLPCALLCGLIGCAPGMDVPAVLEPAGFLLGFWHGMISLITLVVSLFSDVIFVYEIRNSGWSYNLGFILGIISMGAPAAR